MLFFLARWVASDVLLVAGISTFTFIWRFKIVSNAVIWLGATSPSPNFNPSLSSMGTSENDQNQFLAYSNTKILEYSIQDEYSPSTRTISSPLGPANGGSVLTDPADISSLKRKHSKLELQLAPPCRSPDRAALTTLQVAASPILNPPKSKPAPTLNLDVRANTINDADAVRPDPDAINALSAEEHAPEGPHDLPPIAVLPEIASPVLSTRESASYDASPRTVGSVPLPPAPKFSFVNAVASASAVPRAAAAPAPASASPTDVHSQASDLHDADSYAHSYLRRPLRARHLAHPYATRDVAARELDLARELTPAPVGRQRHGWPHAEGVESAAAWVERVREEIGAGDLEMEVDSIPAPTVAIQRPPRPEGWWVQSRPNTAPSAAYAALLEDTFGPGRAQRGEGPKPERMPAKRTGKGKKDKGRSVSGLSGVSVAEAMDVDEGDEGEEIARAEDEVHQEDDGTTRARSWIAQMQVLIKGKRQMTPEDLKHLADTLRVMRRSMTAEEGHALGDDGPLLHESLRQIEQLDDIPFRDEYKNVRIESIESIEEKTFIANTAFARRWWGLLGLMETGDSSQQRRMATQNKQKRIQKASRFLETRTIAENHHGENERWIQGGSMGDGYSRFDQQQRQRIITEKMKGGSKVDRWEAGTHVLASSNEYIRAKAFTVFGGRTDSHKETL
ncbi:hypothetical protein DFH06DRAFT_1294642 [Mycena polygramma]|nr:hypothetical protein DFH06DRAFT_1294642 [Mycena polygramma]